MPVAYRCRSQGQGQYDDQGQPDTTALVLHHAVGGVTFVLLHVEFSRWNDPTQFVAWRQNRTYRLHIATNTFLFGERNFVAAPGNGSGAAESCVDRRQHGFGGGYTQLAGGFEVQQLHDAVFRIQRKATRAYAHAEGCAIEL